jgi:hypothetical protein
MWLSVIALDIVSMCVRPAGAEVAAVIAAAPEMARKVASNAAPTGGILR